MGGSRVRKVFDREYYRRFYGNPATASATLEDVDRLVAFVLRYLEFLRLDVDSVLDVGCGIGLWRDALVRAGSKAQFTGIEASRYLCDKYGWMPGSILELPVRRRYDLVICQGVLPYLERRDVTTAVRNLARACGGALYVECLTSDDRRRGVLDLERTDTAVHFRSARWYRDVFDRHFIACGGGVFLPKGTPLQVFALERT